MLCFFLCFVFQMKEWLCLNCQMQRALGASEPPGLPLMKPQPSPSKEKPEAPTQEKETPVANAEGKVIQPAPSKHEHVSVTTIKETEFPTTSEPTEKVAPAATSMPDKSIPPKTVPLSPQKPSEDMIKGQASKQQLPQVVSATANPTPPSDPKVGKPAPQQPKEVGISSAKSVPLVQSAKQESGGFFGFGGPKTQPIAAKASESVTGKMFGFGSSFLSSASNLITSAVQEEPKATPSSPRKMSVAAYVSPKTTPPASPKKDKKPETPQKKETPVVQTTRDKPPSELSKPPADTLGTLKSDLSICPLCKNSKDLPNFNTCTECRTSVCNQCGFNPMPNVTEVNNKIVLNVTSFQEMVEEGVHNAV